MHTIPVRTSRREQFIVHDSDRPSILEIRDLEIHFDSVGINELGQDDSDWGARALRIRPCLHDDLLSVGTDSVVRDRVPDAGQIEN